MCPFVWQLAQPGNQPFSSDMEYVNLVNAIFEVRHAISNLEDNIKTAYSTLAPRKHEKMVRVLSRSPVS